MYLPRWNTSNRARNLNNNLAYPTAYIQEVTAASYARRLYYCLFDEEGVHGAVHGIDFLRLWSPFFSFRTIPLCTWPVVDVTTATTTTAAAAAATITAATAATTTTATATTSCSMICRST